MSREEERRSYDGEIAGIRKSLEDIVKTSSEQAVDIGEIATAQKIYIKNIEKCNEETKGNSDDITDIKVDDIAPIKTKQNIILGVGTLGVVAIITDIAIRFWRGE